MIPIGLIMTRIEAGPGQDSLYRTHMALGLMILALTGIRLGALVFKRWPGPPPGLSYIRTVAFLGAHVLLYVVLVALIVTGTGMLLLSGLAPTPAGVVPGEIQDVPPRSAHHLLAIVFIVLLAMHVAGVLEHQLRTGDVFSRMGIGWFNRRGAQAGASDQYGPTRVGCLAAS